MERGIPVWIKNSFKPEVGCTKITQSLPLKNRPVRAVTAVTQATLVTLTTSSDVHFAEIFGRLFLRLGHEHIDGAVLDAVFFGRVVGASAARAGHGTRAAGDSTAVSHRTQTRGPESGVSSSERCGYRGVWAQRRRACGILGRLFSAVARTNVSVIAIAQGASELNICFAVAASRANEVVRACIRNS